VSPLESPTGRIIGRLEALAKNRTVNKLLAPAAFVYGAGSYLRILSFSMGLSPRTKAAAPVVSVGNITVGGTGKTPIVIDLADRIAAKGLKPAILSRGYGRKSQAKTVLVSDGAGPVVSVEESGDEPYVMARSVPAATVMVGAKRIESARLVTKNHGADLIVLDDGFQHVQLRRDLDIVLYDYNDDPDTMTLLPQGRLREPMAALSRAHVIVITKIPVLISSLNKISLLDDAVATKLQSLSAKLSALAPQAVLQYAAFCPSYLLGQRKTGLSITSSPGDVLALGQMAGKKIFALCGLARPEGFFQSLSLLGADIVDKIAYPDHHWFSVEDQMEIQRRFQACAAEYLITSEKDMVRLRLSSELDCRTYALMQTPFWLNAQGVEEDNPLIFNLIDDLLAAARVKDGAAQGAHR